MRYKEPISLSAGSIILKVEEQAIFLKKERKREKENLVKNVFN